MEDVWCRSVHRLQNLKKKNEQKLTNRGEQTILCVIIPVLAEIHVPGRITSSNRLNFTTFENILYTGSFHIPTCEYVKELQQRVHYYVG